MNNQMNFEEMLFPKEVTQIMIASRLMKDFPNRWKNEASAKAHVSQTMKDLNIFPIRKDFVTELSDGTRSYLNIYSYEEAVKTYKSILSVTDKKKNEKKDEKPTRMHLAMCVDEGEINLTDSTEIGREAMRIIKEEVARSGKPMAVLAAEIIIEWRKDHPVELTEEEKLKMRIRELENEVKRLKKGGISNA